MHDWFRLSTENLFPGGTSTVETVGRSIERNLPTAVSPAYNAMFDVRKEPSGVKEIYSLNADGSHPVRVTNIGATSILGLAISGDGRKLVFSAVVGGLFRVYTMNADGSNLNVIASPVPSPTGDLPVAINPSGTQVSYSFGANARVCLFASGTLLRTIILPIGNTSIRGLAYDATGLNLAITSNGGLYTIGALAGLPILIDASGNYGKNLCWSPDGSRIAVRFQNQIDVIRLSPRQRVDRVFDGDFGDNATFDIAWR